MAITPPKTQALIATKAPNLPIGPVDYSQQYQDQFSNALRQYFATVDNINQVTAQRVTEAGITFPDDTKQTTAYIPSYLEAFDRTASIAINSTPTLLKPDSFLPATAVGITYDPATGEFTFLNKGTYSLAISLNISATTANQFVYVYAQKNTGSGWVNTSNSGKTYELKNGLTVQFVNPQAVYREAGEQTRYYIYSNGTTSALVTSTLPGVSPTVYVPAVRIQYAGN
jgi:hypothetical protein